MKANHRPLAPANCRYQRVEKKYRRTGFLGIVRRSLKVTQRNYSGPSDLIIKTADQNLETFIKPYLIDNLELEKNRPASAYCIRCPHNVKVG